jgi:Fe-Mn family superoxide dismutase
MEKNTNNRREFLKTTGKAGLAVALASTVLPSFARDYDNNDDWVINFTQKPLSYSYNALEPTIDAMTMEIHYTKHAATYTKNLADAMAAEKVTEKNIEDLLKNISKYSSKMRNNGGGHYNHELFWRSMSKKAEAKPDGKLMRAIERDFNSFDAFKTQFSDAAKNRFGSGWAWLVLTNDNKLVISSTPNQDNPLMDVAEVKGRPVLGLDVWEHAYYLKYQNRRPDYITNWWNVVNWDWVEKRYKKMID